MLSDSQWWEFYQQGFLRLGKLLDDAELAALQERIDEIMLGKVRYEKMMMQLDGGGAYEDMPAQSAGFKGATLDYRKIQDLEQDPRFLAYMQRPLFKKICAEAYGAHAPVACFRAMFMNKPACKGTILPWHQDGGSGWGLDRDPLITVWTALDPATKANGCVQVMPGTHRLGLLSKQGHTISAEQERQHCPEEKIVYLELKAGEVVLLHNWLIHRSDVNKTDVSRRGFSVCYMDGRTRQVKNGGTFPIVFGEGALKPREMQLA
ncbi:MAG: phytanoyl-CoA dioxygenase family protein [Planctomycetes bacterium]|nr:phytanoyl-CoA dioxygenase family protein [Planctomycetota bacterium]